MKVVNCQGHWPWSKQNHTITADLRNNTSELNIINSLCEQAKHKLFSFTITTKTKWYLSCSTYSWNNLRIKNCNLNQSEKRENFKSIKVTKIWQSLQFFIIMQNCQTILTCILYADKISYTEWCIHTHTQTSKSEFCFLSKFQLVSINIELPRRLLLNCDQKHPSDIEKRQRKKNLSECQYVTALCTVAIYNQSSSTT